MELSKSILVLVNVHQEFLKTHHHTCMHETRKTEVVRNGAALQSGGWRQAQAEMLYSIILLACEYKEKWCVPLACSLSRSLIQRVDDGIRLTI